MASRPDPPRLATPGSVQGQAASLWAAMSLDLDTAVRLLSDMAGLKSALNDNVIYVSTAERVVP